MTAPNTENQVQEQKNNDKELNFRRQEQMYQKMLAEKDARLKELEEASRKQHQNVQHDDDDDDNEPYVDRKKLEKKFNKFGQSTKSEIEKAMELAKEKAKEELKQELWLESNPDFSEVMQHANRLAEKAPRLAESILRMPDGFERQRLVYENIKQMKLHEPEQKLPSIQEKIEANRKSPYYQPSGVANSPYGNNGDFSPSGIKNAYEQMQKLKQQLRL